MFWCVYCRLDPNKPIIYVVCLKPATVLPVAATMISLLTRFFFRLLTGNLGHLAYGWSLRPKGIHMRRLKRYIGIVVLVAAMLSTPATAADNVVPGAITVDATLLHLGVRWQISEDDNANAACSVRYRQAGAQTWQQGLDLFRAHPGISGEGGDYPDNRLAGTIFFLVPDTAYEIELTLTDPDGGGQQRVVTATTAKVLTPAAGSTDYYVAPGDGGGTGTQSDPFLGLQEACNNAHPGAVFHVAPGTYSAFSLTTSGDADNPIVLRGLVNPHTQSDPAQWSIVDGAETDRGVFTIGTYDRQTAYLMIENMVIQNGYWGIDAQNSHHILMQHNIVRDVGFGYYNRRDNGWEGHQMLMDNTFVGRTAWPASGIPSERGIDLRGSGNVVCYNHVRNFGDGVSLQPFTQRPNGFANDIYGNDIANIVDDPIEIDYNSCNTRVWRNRVVNSRMGISLAPIYGGPVYVFRNEFFNLESSAYKMNREPAGLVVVHNTSVKLENGTSSPAGWQNTYLRNNVIIGTRYVFEEYGLVAGSHDSWDYDALGTGAIPFAKWDNVRYDDLPNLRENSGIEAHAVGIFTGDLVSAVLPADYSAGIVPGSYDLRLKSGVDAINAGQVLANINDPFVSDGQPDCGAFEYGEDLPLYGPRESVYDPGDEPGDNPSESPSNGDNSAPGGGCFLTNTLDRSRQAF